METEAHGRRCKTCDWRGFVAQAAYSGPVKLCPRCLTPTLEPATVANLQWKGTNVCIDIHCVCGHHSHYDGGFMYYVECPACHQVYEAKDDIILVPRDRKTLSQSDLDCTKNPDVEGLDTAKLKAIRGMGMAGGKIDLIPEVEEAEGGGYSLFSGWRATCPPNHAVLILKWNEERRTFTVVHDWGLIGPAPGKKWALVEEEEG